MRSIWYLIHVATWIHSLSYIYTYTVHIHTYCIHIHIYCIYIYTYTVYTVHVYTYCIYLLSTTLTPYTQLTLHKTPPIPSPPTNTLTANIYAPLSLALRSNVDESTLRTFTDSTLRAFTHILYTYTYTVCIYTYTVYTHTYTHTHMLYTYTYILYIFAEHDSHTIH